MGNGAKQNFVSVLNYLCYGGHACILELFFREHGMHENPEMGCSRSIYYLAKAAWQGP